MSFLKKLDEFCSDRDPAERAALQTLSLTGLQPCFEDTVLVLPVFFIMAGLSMFRMHQCLSQGKFKRTFKELLPTILQALLCLTNLVVTAAILLKLGANASRFQQLVYPFGILGWVFLTISNAVECVFFSYYGQWIHRFLYLWIFVAYSIRWPTQKAIGQASPFEWHSFLICWATQAALLLLMYGTPFVPLSQVRTQHAQLVLQSGDGIELSDLSVKLALEREEEKQTMSERLKMAKSAVSEFEVRLNRNAVEEEKEMFPVPWTTSINPLGRAGLLSKLTYTWMGPLMAFARKNTVEPTDVWDLQARFKSIDNFHYFEQIWLEEKAKHLALNEIEREKSHPLRATIVRAFGHYHAWAGPLLLIQNVAQLGLPFILKYLLQFLSPVNTEPLYHGYLYSFGFFGSLMVMTLAENQYFHRAQNTATMLKAAFVPTIFRHSLRLSNQSRQERSIGAIVSHMSGDTDKIAGVTMIIHNLWSCPIRLILGLIMLISGLGVSGVVGFLAVIFLIPVQTYVMKKMVALNKEVMGKSDARIRACNEVLAGMRVIKYYAWEKPFGDKVEALRKAELGKLKDVAIWRALSGFFTSLNPIAMSCATFIAFAIIKGNLTSPQAFQALTLFSQMVWPLMLFPSTLSGYLDSLTSVDRIESFLLSSTVKDPLNAEQAAAAGIMDETGLPNPEVKDSICGQYLRIADGPVDIRIENGTYSWSDKAGAALVDINIDITPGSLVAIVGSTGQGKSSLIGAIIGDMLLKHGRAKMAGSFAYAPQTAWIYNASVKENILFGSDYDEERYTQAIELSCLKADIEKQFAAGDSTELGEKGVNLSGGQRQRVNIARALYASADILIFDDPLSALDPHIGNEIFHNIRSKMAGKTRIMATNQLHLAAQFDRILVLKNGRIIENGTFAELKAKAGGEFRRLHDELGAVPEEDVTSKKTPLPSSSSISSSLAASDPSKQPVSAVVSVDSAGGKSANKAVAEGTTSTVSKAPAQSQAHLSVKEKKSGAAASAVKDAHEQAAKDVGKLVKEEAHSVGSVPQEVYLGYLRAVGWQASAVMILGIVFAQATQIGSSMWIAYWASQSSKPAGSGSNRSAAFYVGIYTALSVGQILLTLSSNLIGFAGSVRGSASMHSDFMRGMMMSPQSFFDSTPMGRISNRVAKDFSQIDSSLMTILQMVVRAFVGLLGQLIIIGINTTYVLVIFVPILMLFMAVQAYFISAAIQFKRLEAITRSPVYAHFSECLGGISTIRAYGAQPRMSVINAQRQDCNAKVSTIMNLTSRWLSVRLEFLGGMLILGTAINCVIQRGHIDPSSAGVSLSYALMITTQLNMLIRVVTEVEGSFNSVERIQEYSALASEPAHETDAKLLPLIKDWPSKGEICMTDLVVSYTPDRPAVLKGINLLIKPAEKIGVVGRTGAGKSSLFQALFRIMEPTSGKMTFDGVDLCGLGLDDVRRAISIIPQEPVLFAGTLRFNLDPFSQYSDTEIWDALDKSSLKKLLLSKGETLAMEVIDGGENFSVGQRQLLCLSRALLKKSKILVLDEATASVDLETDALIQDTIRKNFADRTTLTIAHRLNTIIDSDKVLVLNFGKVLEFDSPKNLLSNPNSEFSAMVRDTGPDNEKSLRATAFGEKTASELTAQREETKRLADVALDRMQQGDQLMWGPLMNTYKDSAAAMRSAWDDRHASKWETELHSNNVPMSVWMNKMAELLQNVNLSAQQALDVEHVGLSFQSYATGAFNRDRVTGHDDQFQIHNSD